MAKSEENHTKCIKAAAKAEKEFMKKEDAFLKFATVIQNRFQDICDVLDGDLDDEKKVAKIQKLNEKIGNAVVKVLPE